MSANENQLQQMLVTLRTRLLVMSAMVGLSVEDACKALQDGDVGRASAVIDGDAAINELENEIDAKALSLLARTQPVACDLRLVVSALRMVIDLERIADEACSIAERTLTMQGTSLAVIAHELEELIEIVRSSFVAAINAFRTGNTEEALAVRKHEDDAVLLDMRIVHKLTQKLETTPDPHVAMYGILVSRSLNRIWRRSMNLAEHTYFTYAGESLKHKHV